MIIAPTAKTGTGRLAGKTCFVTGGAQGIGRAIVEAFAREGAEVIAADRDFGDAAAFGDGVHRLSLDVTDDAAVAQAALRWPQTAVLVNCVGYVASGTILESPLDAFDRSYAVNTRSMVSTIRAFLPAMLVRREGAIINIASVVSSVMAAPNRCAYATSKAAVIGLTMAVAKDYIAEGIRCNAISPGTIETPSLGERFAETGDVTAARAAFMARQPTGRLGRADEIAATALLLASDDAPFLTGTNILVDGGMSL